MGEKGKKEEEESPHKEKRENINVINSPVKNQLTTNRRTLGKRKKRKGMRV